jgi:hypothetical protein
MRDLARAAKVGDVGFRRGKNGLLGASSWWVDTETYSLAYMRGMGVELVPPAKTAMGATSPTRSVPVTKAERYRGRCSLHPMYV